MTELAQNCITRQLVALENLRSVVASDEYAAVRDRILSVANDSYNSRVLVAGVGKNSSIASKISDTMASLGIPSHALNVSHLGHGDYGRIGHNDLIIHISRSGQTREMLEAIDHISLIRPSVCQILIHCKPNKPWNKNVDFELFIGEAIEGDEFKLAPTTSTSALLCLLDCLSVEVSATIGFKRLDFLKFHPDGQLGDLLRQEQASTQS